MKQVQRGNTIQNNTSIDQLIKEINDIMPTLQIYKPDFLRPTPDFVFKFYSHFWTQLEERLSEFKFEEVPEYSTCPDMEVESKLEDIFLKISLIFDSTFFCFRLEDIYEPQTIRTKYLFKLCVHFLVFIDNIDDDVKQNFKSLIDIFDKISFAPQEEQRLLSIMEDNAFILSKLKSEKQKLCQNYEDTSHLHTELQERKIQRENRYNAKLKQAENLKVELDTKTSHLKQLTEEETILSNQIVIPAEYEILQTKLQILEKEMFSVNNARTQYKNDIEKIHTRLSNYQEASRLISNYSEIDVSFLSSLLDNEEQLKNVKIQNDSISEHLETLKEKKEQYREKEKKLEIIRRGYMDKLKEIMNDTIIQLESEFKLWQTDLKQKQQVKSESSNRLEEIALASTSLNKAIFEWNTHLINNVAQQGMQGLDQCFSRVLSLLSKKDYKH